MSKSETLRDKIKQGILEGQLGPTTLIKIADSAIKATGVSANSKEIMLTPDQILQSLEESINRFSLTGDDNRATLTEHLEHLSAVQEPTKEYLYNVKQVSRIATAAEMQIVNMAFWKIFTETNEYIPSLLHVGFVLWTTSVSKPPRGSF